MSPPKKKRLDTLHSDPIIRQIPMSSILFYGTCPGLLNFYETHEKVKLPPDYRPAAAPKNGQCRQKYICWLHA